MRGADLNLRGISLRGKPALVKLIKRGIISNKKTEFNAKFITLNAIIASLYVALTFITYATLAAAIMTSKLKNKYAVDKTKILSKLLDREIICKRKGGMQGRVVSPPLLVFIKQVLTYRR